jgi:hypothetical protein
MTSCSGANARNTSTVEALSGVGQALQLDSATSLKPYALIAFRRYQKPKILITPKYEPEQVERHEAIVRLFVDMVVPPCFE